MACRRANSRCGGSRSPPFSRPAAISSATASATDRKSFTRFASLVNGIESLVSRTQAQHCTECNAPY